SSSTCPRAHRLSRGAAARTPPRRARRRGARSRASGAERRQHRHREPRPIAERLPPARDRAANVRVRGRSVSRLAAHIMLTVVIALIMALATAAPDFSATPDTAFVTYEQGALLAIDWIQRRGSYVRTLSVLTQSATR